MLNNFIQRVRLKHLLKEQIRSETLRRIFQEKHGIEIGLYSDGCFDPTRVARGTVIGRYCSFTSTAHVFNGNHGLHFLTTHPFLYNPVFGMVEKESIQRRRCTISDDVWVGHNAIILPSVAEIGRGAVIAAGSIVTKNVPPFAVVGGNPAKVIKYRFAPEIIAAIEKSEWWLKEEKELEHLMHSIPGRVFSPAIYFATS